MTRRSLLGIVPAGAALAAVTSVKGVHVGCQTNAWRIDPGQFSTLLAALKAIKALGFEGFETGFRNLGGQFGQPDSAKRELKASGLRFFAAHIFLTDYDPQSSIAPWDLIIRVAQGASALGAERLIVSGAAVGSSMSFKAAALNRAGEFCRQQGLRLAYHNHGPEFSNGGVEINGLLGQTDPGRVHFVVDAGHAMRAGANLAEFFEQHHERIDGMHLRDFKQEQQVPLGRGEFDYRSLAAAMKKAKWGGWVLAEEERPSGEKPAEAAAGPARQTIRNLFGV